MLEFELETVCRSSLQRKYFGWFASVWIPADCGVLKYLQIINSLENLTDSKHNLFPNSVIHNLLIFPLHSSLSLSPLAPLVSNVTQLARALRNKTYNFFVSKNGPKKPTLPLLCRSDKLLVCTNLLIFVVFFVFTKWTSYCFWEKDKNSHYHLR